MDIVDGHACVLCMLSGYARAMFDINWIRQIAENKVTARYAFCTVVYQSVVDKRGAELSVKERAVRNAAFEVMRRRKFAVLILYGDKLTEFGEHMWLAAKEEGVPVYVVGFGTNTFGRRYRRWHRPYNRLTEERSRQTALAVQEADARGFLQL